MKNQQPHNAILVTCIKDDKSFVQIFKGTGDAAFNASRNFQMEMAEKGWTARTSLKLKS